MNDPLIRMYTGNRLGVWNEDFPLIKFGHKTEIRAYGNLTKSPNYPSPCLMYTTNHSKTVSRCLIVVEGAWRERIMAITPESLDAEGFSTIEEFKHYWLLRTGERPRAMSMVVVRAVRPWAAGDALAMGSKVLRQVYGNEAVDEALRTEQTY